MLLTPFLASDYVIWMRFRLKRTFVGILKDVHENCRIHLLCWSQKPGQPSVLLIDGDHQTNHDQYEKSINVIYDYRAEHPTALQVPYTMYPHRYMEPDIQENIVVLRDQSKKIRIMFAGNYSQSYQNEFICGIFEKLDRHSIISHLINTNSVRIIESGEQREELLEEAYCNHLVIFQETARIPFDKWLALLAHANFFLAPPGITIPLCHNIIEAMSVGTIPITNYPEWFSPPLQSGQNCLTFTSLEDLDRIMAQALTMSNQEIETLRQGVLAYYDTHLDMKLFLNHTLQQSSSTVSWQIIDENRPRIIQKFRGEN